MDRVKRNVGLVAVSQALLMSGQSLFLASSGFGSYYRFAVADAADETFRSRTISLVLAGGVVAAFAGSKLANWSREWIAGAAFSGGWVAYGAVVPLVAFLWLSSRRRGVAKDPV